MPSRPNLLVFIPDQLRADSVGCFGNPVVQTPNMDALAARGTRFCNAYAQHSVCSPSRISFLTGWYPHVRGHRTLEHLLKPWEPSVLQQLKRAGYYVAHVGLRGDTFAKGVTGQLTDRFGFAIRMQMTFMSSPYPAEHRFARAFYHGKRPHAETALDFDEACTRTAEEWLAEGLPEPWILYVPLVFPHPPFEVEEPWYSMHSRREMPAPAPPPEGELPRYMRLIRERYGTGRLSPEDWAEIRATYYGMIARVDHQLGRVLRAVEASGAAERTATFLFPDHGEYLGDYGLIEKWCAGQHDCLLHSPLVIAAPGGREGNLAAGLVELLDVAPTMLELAGVEADYSHFGRSLVRLLRDGSLPHRDAAFSEGGHLPSEEAIVERAQFPYDLKTAIGAEDPLSNGKVVTVRTEAWTYVHRLYECNELYDRRADPRQLRNLAGAPEHAEVERGLRDRVLDWMIETADVVPWEADPRFDAEGAVSARRV